MAKAEFPFMPFDVAKMLSEFRVPGLDVDAMLKAQRKNLDALAEANKAAAEGYQAVAKRQAEILKETMEEATAAVREAMSGGSPEANAARQAELFKAALERALGNMRELAELTAKANSEAFERVNKRMMESIDELKQMLTRPRK